MHNVAQELPEIDYYFTNPYPPLKSVGAHGSLSWPFHDEGNGLTLCERLS